MTVRALTDDLEESQLLRSVAEQLKAPLTVIARQAELLQLEPRLGAEAVTAQAQRMELQAHVALALVDSYLLGLQLMRERAQLALEPVSVPSLLNETAHELHGYAKQHNVELAVTIGGSFAPVMAHQKGLKAALLSLGYMLVGAQPEGARRRINLVAHRTAGGTTAGIYGAFGSLSAAQWQRAIKLHGSAQQPFTALLAGSGAGVFIAEAILQAMSTRLRVGRYSKLCGLAATLQPSQQLALI